MDEKLLVSLGIPQNLAHAYRALILKKSLRPTQYVKLSGESRSNAYARLDKLVDLGLATKSDENKKFIYYPVSPTVLKELLSKQLSQTEEQLALLERRLPQMLSEYHTGGEQPKVKQYKGRKELIGMFTEQMEQPGRNLYFIRSIADVPYFTLETMSQIRRLAPKYKKRRWGITPIVMYAHSNSRKDARTGGLKRAWIKREEYTAPVEWAVSGNQVQAVCMNGEGYGISIEHPEIAESMRQILQLLFEYIKSSPGYEKLPILAKHNEIDTETND